MTYLIGVDIGTSATKTVLFDENMQVRAEASASYPLSQPQNGWAEQQPTDWAQAALTTIRDCVTLARVPKEEIRGIGLSGQMHGLVMLDAAGAVIRPAMIWCDQRTGAECEEITQRVGKEKLIRITANPALTGFTASKILWVRKHEPGNYARCRHILLPKDYVRYCLTGEFATEVSDASGMQLLDVPHRCWSQEMLKLLDIDPSLLAKVYESSEITGTLTPEAASFTGLSTKTAVVGGAGDNAAAAIGTGIVEEGKAFTTIGTSGVVYAHTREPHIDPQGRVHTFCCAVPGCWHVMGVTQAAGLSLRWFRDTCARDLVAQADARQISVYKLINEAAQSVPRGSHRLFYLPYLMGERTPHLDPVCRGVFFGLSAMHTQADMLRAVMEGVAYSLTDSLEILQGMGIAPQTMMACGGGAKSPVWRQMLADMYGLPMQTLGGQEGPALGAAILAGVGTGLFSDVPSACYAFIRPQAAGVPDAEAHAYYARAHRLYQKLYQQLRGCYQELGKY